MPVLGMGATLEASASAASIEDAALDAFLIAASRQVEAEERMKAERSVRTSSNAPAAEEAQRLRRELG